MIQIKLVCGSEGISVEDATAEIFLIGQDSRQIGIVILSQMHDKSTAHLNIIYFYMQLSGSGVCSDSLTLSQHFSELLSGICLSG